MTSTNTKDSQQIRDEVSEYYGKVLASSQDLKTNACCTKVSMPKYIKDILGQIHEEVLARYYGCGLCIPALLEGCKVLDLGSGAGRDCFLCQKLVGEQGEVVGVDMTQELLNVANQYLQYHTDMFGFKNQNVSFKRGNIERLSELRLQENYFDVAISNCVINLCPDKEAALSEVYRTLKAGGEFYFSDIYCNRRLPRDLLDDPVLYGECLSGALYSRDFVLLAQKVGFNDPRVVEMRDLDIENKEIEAKVEGYKFYSITYRLFKLPDLERTLEDYGHMIIYKGTIAEYPDSFVLDSKHTFKTGMPVHVDGNTVKMIKFTRFAPHFTVEESCSIHLGEFNEDMAVGGKEAGRCC